jgi:hypothetical protein
LTAGAESGVGLARGAVPTEKLLAGGLGAALMEQAEEGGGGEALGAEVEDEIDESIELALGERSMHETGDGLSGAVGIAREQSLGGLGSEPVGEDFMREQTVTVTDGGMPGEVGISVRAKALAAPDEAQERGTGLHGIPRGGAGSRFDMKVARRVEMIGKGAAAGK